MQQVEEQINELRSDIEQARLSVVQRIQAEYESAKRRADLVNQDYMQQVRLISTREQKPAHYGLLKREVDGSADLQLSMLERVKEMGISSAIVSNVRIVDTAEDSGRPLQAEESVAQYSVGTRRRSAGRRLPDYHSRTHRPQHTSAGRFAELSESPRFRCDPIRENGPRREKQKGKRQC